MYAIIPILVAVGLSIYNVFFASERIKESFIFGFQFGAAISLGIISIAFLILYRRVLTDDKKLKLQYNKENDERLKTIRAKAGVPMVLITSIFMIIAGIIAGYFNLTIFITLVVAAVSQMLIAAVTKQIYLRKL
ncbi:MAG: hypothetical protein ACOX2M_04225 [Fastidiosipilaceae bacterium]|jgi:hypothetical protein